jgi:hypothetical protein
VQQIFLRYCAHPLAANTFRTNDHHNGSDMAITKRQIMEAIPGLPPHDIADIIEWCHSFGPRSTKPGDNADTEQAYNELAACFSDYFRKSYPTTFLRFAHSRPRQYKALIAAATNAMQCVNAWWPNESRIVRLGLLRYVCRVAFDVSTRRTARLTWARVIGALLETEATINDGFPGWIKAGLFQERALARVKGTGEQKHVRDQSTAETRPASQHAAGRKGFLHRTR